MRSTEYSLKWLKPTITEDMMQKDRHKLLEEMLKIQWELSYRCSELDLQKKKLLSQRLKEVQNQLAMLMPTYHASKL